MGMKLKDMIKQVTPPVILYVANQLRRHQYGFTGDYLSWAEAVAASKGYDSDIILEKTKTALLKVKSGEAVYERDSVLFDEIQYSWPVLAGLLWAAARSGGVLNVLDFGGSLGSTFFQNRLFIRDLREVRWNIVEQHQHVAAGRKYFEDGCLKFYTSITECLNETKPNLAILSGVLQYLESPYDVLAKLFESSCETMIIDRTPFWDANYDKLGIQHIDPAIFDTSYPMWVFSLKKFRDTLQLSGSAFLAEFESLEKEIFGLAWKGFIIRIKNNAQY